MTELYPTLVACTVAICLLVAAANVMLAARSISSGAATAFAIGFGAMGLTWALTLLIPQVGDDADVSLLVINSTAVVATSGLWSGFWLRAGWRIPWRLLIVLGVLWLAPIVATLAVGLPRGTYVPFATLAIAVGVLSSLWTLLRKRGARNAGDYALIAWLALALPVSVAALYLGMNTARAEPNNAWVFYAGLLPTLFTGIGLFTLLGFTLDAITDSVELARTDGLTGLLNRRAFDSELGIAAARAERYQRDLSLVLIDIDHFKALNDTFGHPAGDAVLRIVARTLVANARRVDVAARIGGEEFAIILADTPSAAALRLAERAREAISAAGVERISFTASLGVASLGADARTPAALLKAADTALYVAKQAGRNRVRFAGDPHRDAAELIAPAVSTSRAPG